MSKPITAEIASTNGITEGTSLRIFSVSQGESWYNEFIDLPNLEYPTAWNWNNSKYVLFIGEDSPNGYSELQWRGEKFVYTTMTQAIYDDHKNAMIGLQAKIKETYLLIEGIADIPEWIEPEVPAWNDSAELSGYVRDSRSLPISGATVRLIDADGVNHDLVTNDLGYYHFTKEYIYNNISFGTASSAEFDMFVLEETISGTVLYEQTNIFQNSFFGAVNNRDLSWPVLVKDVKTNRRNFKIEFIPDYSSYPSISGYVYNDNGNPIENALVIIQHPTGINIATRIEGNNVRFDKKYTEFGVEKSILTDANGYYEYSSQMVGEWFNKYGFSQNSNGFNIPIDSLSNPQLSGYTDNVGDELYSNQFMARLVPYIQNPLTTEIEYDGDISKRIYDQTDFFNSRFEYANNRYDFVTLNMGQNTVINVTETLSNPETGAEKLYIIPDAGTQYPEGSTSYFSIATTTGFIKVKWADGTEEIQGWPGNTGYSSSPVNISFHTTETEPFYVYSCEGQYGAADGKIWKIEDTSGRPSGDLTSFDTDELTNLRSLVFNGSTIKSLDFSGPGFSNLENLDLSNMYDFQLVNLEQLNSSRDLSIHLDGQIYSKKEVSTTNFIRKYRSEDTRTNQVTTWTSGEVHKSKMLENGDILAMGSMELIAIQNPDYIEIPVNKIVLIKPNYEIIPFYNNTEHQINGGNIKNFEILEDGSMIIIGDFNSISKSDGTSFSTFGVAKLTSNGLIDETFMNNLINPVDHDIVINGYFDFRSIIVRPNGKIILGNVAYNDSTSIGVNTYTDYDNTDSNYLNWGDFVSSQEYYSIIRLNSDGSIDNTFNAYKQTEPDSTISHFGHVTGAVYGLEPYSETQFFVHGWMQNKRYIDPNGDLYASGISQPIILMDYDGNIDIDSAANLYINVGSVNINSLKVQSDGKILLSGNLSSIIPNLDPNIPGYQISKLVWGAYATLARLNSDFTVDEDFMDNILVHNDDSLQIDLLSNGDIRLKGHSGSRYFDPVTNDTSDYYSQIVTLNPDGTIKSKEYPTFVGGTRSVVDIYETETYSIVLGGYYQMQNGKGNVYGGGVAKLNRGGVETFKIELPDTPTSLVRVQNNQIVNEIILKSTDEFVVQWVHDLKKIDLSQVTNIDKIYLASIYNTRVELYIGSGDITMTTELTLDYLMLPTLPFLASMTGLKKFVYHDGVSLSSTLDLSMMTVLERLSLRTPSSVNIGEVSTIKYLELIQMDASSFDLTDFSNSLETLRLLNVSSLPDLSFLPSFVNLNELVINGVTTNLTISNTSLKKFYIDQYNMYLTLDTPNLEELNLSYVLRNPVFSSIMNNLHKVNISYSNFNSIDFTKMPQVRRLSLQDLRNITDLNLSPLVSLEMMWLYYWSPSGLQTLVMPSSNNLEYVYTSGIERTVAAGTVAGRKTLLTSIWSGLSLYSSTGGYISYSSVLQASMDASVLAYRNTKPNWSIGLN
jgi:hypothetical protein